MSGQSNPIISAALKRKRPKLSNKIRAIRKRETGVDPLDELKAKRARKDLPSKLKKPKIGYGGNSTKRKLRCSITKQIQRSTTKSILKNFTKAIAWHSQELKSLELKLKKETQKDALIRKDKNWQHRLKEAEFWVKYPEGDYAAFQSRQEKKQMEAKEKAERERMAEIEANRAKSEEMRRRKNEMPFVDKGRLHRQTV